MQKPPSPNLLKDQIQIGYEYGQNNRSRSHFHTVQPTNLEEKYNTLKGDALKRAILLNFKGEIEKCESIKDLYALIAELKVSPEYNILKTAQRPVTRYLGEIIDLETSAVKAFNEMINQAEQILTPSSELNKTSEKMQEYPSKANNKI